MASAGEILREWQQRFPERFVEAHLSILQRRLREIRASLVASQAELGKSQIHGASSASHASSEPSLTRENTAPLADVPAGVLPDPVGAPLLRSPTPETKTPPVHRPQASVSAAQSSKEEGEVHLDSTVQALPEIGSVKAPLPATMTIDHAIRLFLQGEHMCDWEPKTREWHETSLGQLQRYAAWQKLLLLPSLASNEIRGWLTFLRTEALVTGTFRVQSTIATYARSAHAWCAWLVE